jgi:peptidoglycan/xylan/chitin deacetylase (PgdA/CDA1 family)
MTDYSQFLADDTYAIFLFHGVVPSYKHPVRNYTRKHISLERFTEILESLKARGTAVSMPEIVEATQTGRPLPPGAFSITFDDGFENNYSVAAPAMRALEIPGMFYVTSGFIDENGASWIDLIEYAVERTPVVSLTLPYAGLTGQFVTVEEKIALLNRVRQVVKGDRSIDPYAFAAEVARQTGAGFEPDPDLDQKMSWEQVRAMSEDPLFTIGGHSHTHRIMAYLEPDELVREVDLSLDLVRPHVAGPLTHYSYPEGLTFCYSDEVIRLLMERGIVCSPSAEHGVNRLGDDLFHLKRVMV